MSQTDDLSSLDILWTKMRNELQNLCESSKGVLGYSLMDLQSEKRASFNEDILIPTASSIKIPVLLALALKVHNGELQWETPIVVKDEEKVGGSGILTHLKYSVNLSVWDHASLMIALSDNTSTNICIKLAGMDFINQMLNDLGLRNTKIRRIMMDYEAAQRGEENVSTPGELMELVRQIEQRDGIKNAVAEDVLKILELPKGGPFRDGLPEKVKRANKTGGLGNLSVDAGLIYLTKKTFALAVMGAFLEGRPAYWTTSIVKAAYTYMNLLDKCTDLGRS